MGLTNNLGKLSNTIASNGTAVTIGGTTITDGNLLNVIGNQSSVNVGLVLNNTNGTYPKIYGLQNVNNNFVLYDYSASATRLTIASTGAATFSSSIALSASSGFPAVGLLNRSSDNNLYMVAASSGFVLLDNSQNTMYNATPTSHTWQISNSPKMTLNSSGNLGIGVTPQSWFSSYKALQIGASMSLFQDGSTTSSYYGGNLYVGTDGNFKYTINGSSGLFGVEGGSLVFYTAPSGTAGNTATITERFNISNNGRVNIYSNQTYCLNVNHTNNVSGIGTFVTSMGSNAANTSSYHYIATTGGADRLYIFGNGNVVNTNNSYGPLSDIKLKENITDTTPKLDKLLQVRIVNYNLKSDLGYESNKQIGVIAQELEQVFPSLVDEHIDRDSEGNDLGTTTKSVKMSVFVPMLIKAIQELSAKVTALENK